ncbi:hypothetical protein Dimus_013204, partial [Dionaea muscipula]
MWEAENRARSLRPPRGPVARVWSVVMADRLSFTMHERARPALASPCMARSVTSRASGFAPCGATRRARAKQGRGRTDHLASMHGQVIHGRPMFPVNAGLAVTLHHPESQ